MNLLPVGSPALNYDQAMTLVDSALAEVPGSRREHAQIQQAMTAIHETVLGLRSQVAQLQAEMAKTVNPPAPPAGNAVELPVAPEVTD